MYAEKSLNGESHDDVMFHIYTSFDYILVKIY